MIITEHMQKDLIADCEEEISALKLRIEYGPWYLKPKQKSQLKRQQIALAALLAKPEYFQWKWARDENASWTTTPIEQLENALAAFGGDGENVNYRMQYTYPPVPVIASKSSYTPNFDTISLEAARSVMLEVDNSHELIGRKIQLLSRIQCIIDNALKSSHEFTELKFPELPSGDLVYHTANDTFGESGCMMIPVSELERYISEFKRINGVTE